MARITYTIEVSWTHQSYSDEIEIEDEDLDGLTPDEREKYISQAVQDAVENVASWGWTEDDDSGAEAGR